MILPDKIKKGHFVDLKKQRGIWEVRISPDDPQLKKNDTNSPSGYLMRLTTSSGLRSGPL